MVWRDKVDPLLRNYLEKEIQESVKYKKAYSSSENPGLAQIWVAVANLSRELFDLNLKLNYLERVLKEISQERKSIPLGRSSHINSLKGKSVVEKKSKVRKTKKK